MAQTSTIPGIPASRRTFHKPRSRAPLHVGGLLAIRCSSVGGLLPDRPCPPLAQPATTTMPYTRSIALALVHRGVGDRLDASRQGARGARRPAVRRRLGGRLRQGSMVRTCRRKMRIPIRRHIRAQLTCVAVPKLCIARKNGKKFSTGLWLQQQDLFERLLPARLSRRQISRWKVLMHTGRRAQRDPLFRHIIAYKLPRSCFAAGAGLPARTRAR